MVTENGLKHSLMKHQLYEELREKHGSSVSKEYKVFPNSKSFPTGELYRKADVFRHTQSGIEVWEIKSTRDSVSNKSLRRQLDSYQRADADVNLVIVPDSLWFYPLLIRDLFRQYVDSLYIYDFFNITTSFRHPYSYLEQIYLLDHPVRKTSSRIDLVVDVLCEISLNMRE